ncbi:hypothetical protein GW17_00031791, partial [Ensete ventricosum]
ETILIPLTTKLCLTSICSTEQLFYKKKCISLVEITMVVTLMISRYVDNDGTSRHNCSEFNGYIYIYLPKVLDLKSLTWSRIEAKALAGSLDSLTTGSVAPSAGHSLVKYCSAARTAVANG